MSHPLPEVNQLVRVRIGEDPDGYASRVEDVQATTLVLAAPSYAGDLLTTRVGMTVMVQWTGARGVFEVDGELDDVRRHDSVLLWSVRAVSAVRVTQRRRYARARCEVPMTFVPQDTGPAAVVTGTGVDISEGGLRARVPVGALAERTRVAARLELDGLPVDVLGIVLKATRAGRRTEIVMIFEDPVADEAIIRRWVLRQQVLARRTEAS